jgi:DNA polymerase I - 3''-5'' exonuclease and polymerase domains
MRDYAKFGELNRLLERGINTASTKQMREFLYDPPPAGCGFPPRYIKDGVKNTTKLSTAVDAILATYRQNRDRRLELCLLLSDRLTQMEALNAKVDRDGRMRFSFNIAGTKVGRLSCGASNTGSGINGQTISDRHKCLFPADEGCDFYSVDLKGADGWTIGAECAALGDTRMWDDLSSGLKPANSVTLLWLHGLEVNQWPMDRCLEAQAKLDEKDWRYGACKSGIWGTCYGEGDVTLSTNLLEESWKSGGDLIYVSAADCKKLQNAVHARYPGIRRRMERIKMLLVRDGKLTPQDGAPARDFFAKKTDNSTQAAAYAYAPAFNTALANNKAMLKLWSDPENRDASGQRIARLRLPVHDSITFVAPVERREWVASRLPLWFDNPLTVAGKTFTIPYKAKYGPDWGDLHSL